MKQIIMFKGGSRCGKDTVAKKLAEKLSLDGKSIEIIPFAKELKEFVAKILKIDTETLDLYKNENKMISICIEDDPYRSVMATREFMIDVAKLLKNIDSDILTNMTLKSIMESESDYIIIPDLRFKREFDIIKSHFENSLCVEIVSDLERCGYDNHEYDLDLISSDVTFLNLKDRDLDENVTKLKEFIQYFQSDKYNVVIEN